MSRKTISQLMSRRDAVVWIVLFAAVLAPGLAAAQMGRGRGPQLTPEDRDAAWALQAKHVAGKLGLAEEASGKLVATYREAREGFGKAMEAMRQQGGAARNRQESRRGDFRKAYTELVAKERAKFEKALAGVLTEEQAKKAAGMLGSFSSRQDLMVHTIASFNLDAKQGEALEAVNTYVVETAKLWESPASQGEDRTQLRDKMGNNFRFFGRLIAVALMLNWDEEEP